MAVERSEAKSNEPAGMPHRDFLETALSAAGEWTRYADPKVLGVLVLLGFGINDLIGNADRYLHPHEPADRTCGVVGAVGHSCEGILATGAFFVACAMAVFVVLFVTFALFSRLKMSDFLGIRRRDRRPRSLFFFSEVARYATKGVYADAVFAVDEHALMRDLAGQVYEVSCVCHQKHVAARRAYAAAVVFLVAWVGGRILLATVR